MNSDELKLRTKGFALRIIKLVDALPKTTVARCIGSQIVRSGTAVAANYRASCRARSRAEFVAKIGTVEEESDETALWIELLIESGTFRAENLKLLLQEARELTAIMASSRKTASGKQAPSR